MKTLIFSQLQHNIEFKGCKRGSRSWFRQCGKDGFQSIHEFVRNSVNQSVLKQSHRDGSGGQQHEWSYGCGRIAVLLSESHVSNLQGFAHPFLCEDLLWYLCGFCFFHFCDEEKLSGSSICLCKEVQFWGISVRLGLENETMSVELKNLTYKNSFKYKFYVK